MKIKIKNEVAEIIIYSIVDYYSGFETELYLIKIDKDVKKIIFTMFFDYNWGIKNGVEYRLGYKFKKEYDKESVTEQIIHNDFRNYKKEISELLSKTKGFN